MKRLLHLVIFLAIFWCFCVSDMNDKRNRYLECIKTFKSDEINLYFFYGNKFMNKTFDKTELKNFDMNGFYGAPILTCVCRETYEPLFFISPYYNNRTKTFVDVYYYCVLGKPESFDDYEIYDNLLFESIKTIPNTLMTPLKKDDTCFDKYGFGTKSIANQNTCFFAFQKINSKIEVYSGPLISSELPKIGSNIFKEVPSCYTSVKDTTFKPVDSCIYIPSDPVFLCCCSKEHKNCRIDSWKEKKLFCAPPELSYTNGGLINYSMEKYLNESVNYACGIKITTIIFDENDYGEGPPKYEVEYFSSSNSCPSEFLNISESGFCSSKPEKPKNIVIQKCCQNGHFCNLNLTSIDLDEFIFNKCISKPDISLYFDSPSTCELYYDLTLEKRVYLHENFTTKIIHRTWYDDFKRIITYESGLHTVSYQCYYIYAQIINVDSKECSEQNYNESGLIKPFYYCTCQNLNCDSQHFLPKIGFKCETLMKTNINNVNNQVDQIYAGDKWICFVTTEFFTEESQIEAGHLDMNTGKGEMKECLKKDITNSKFCCVNIVKTNQSDTECTVEKQIQRFKTSKVSYHDVSSEYITCLSKDILNMESESCPKTGGCFSTRITRPSRITSTDAIEPAGCLGYAEKYATLNLPLTSLSLGCRTNENSNRCSVVYGPNGEQRIVCCCNENDGNGKCETNLEKIPNNIGKPILSFKSLN
uniref:Uncharacterized protein n=1 Tax=Panagrolaimus davidi TaxID=227884 RepID=A0A914QT49_9BILA